MVPLMSTEAAPFNSSALLTEWVSRSETPAEAEPAAETPSVEQAPVETSPDQTGTPAEPPQDAQPPAPEVPQTPTQEEFDRLLARFGGDRKKLTDFVIGTEQRAKKYALELKAVRRTMGQPEPPQVQEPAPEEMVVPAPAGQPPPDMDKAINLALSQDKTCVQYHSEYHANKARQDEIVAALGEIDTQIRSLSAFVAPPEIATKLGLQVPELDQFAKQDFVNQISALRSQKNELILERMEKVDRNRLLADAYDERRNAYTKDFSKRYEEEYREVERQDEFEQMTTDFKTEWEAALPQVFRDLNVPEEDRKDIEEKAKEAAFAAFELSPGSLKDGKSYDFIKRVAKREMDFADRVTRRSVASYGKAKTADIQQPAPVGKAAQAVPSPTENPDWEKALRSSVMATFGRRA